MSFMNKNEKCKKKSRENVFWEKFMWNEKKVIFVVDMWDRLVESGYYGNSIVLYM